MATNLSNTDETTLAQAVTAQPSKLWRPIRPITVSDPTEDRLNQLQGKINNILTQLGGLSTTVAQSTASNPTTQPNSAAQVTGVSAAVTTKNVNGSLMSVIDVSFTPGVNFGSAQVWLTGYNGNASPQLVTQGFTSPIEFLVQTTGELVTITVVALNAAGVPASFSDAPTTSVLLNGTNTAPPAPTISQSLVAITGGWQFAFNILNGLLADVISGYWVYRSTVHTLPTGTSQRFMFLAQPGTIGPYTFQDIVSGTYYYWVSAVSASGLESALTDASATVITAFDYPTTAATATTGFTSPALAYDHDETTSATASLATNAGTTTLTEDETWSGFAALPGGVTITDVTLQVLSYGALHGSGSVTLKYSLDGGTTFSTLYSLANIPDPDTGIIGYSSAVKQWYSASLSLSQNLTLLQVKAFAHAGTYTPPPDFEGGRPVTHPTQYASATQNIFECRVSITYH